MCFAQDPGQMLMVKTIKCASGEASHTVWGTRVELDTSGKNTGTNEQSALVSWY